MKRNFIFWATVTVLIFACDTKKEERRSHARLYVDPATNAEDPEIRMAYGLNIVPPWPDGGSVFVNLPEHLEYMPGTRGIARHHDKRTNVWKANADSTEAGYDVESLTEPGVFFSVIAKTMDSTVNFEVTIRNRSKQTLHSLRPLFCFQYHHLKGFPMRLSDNFKHTFTIAGGKCVAVSDVTVRNPKAIARMAQVRDCVDEHNWWAEEMGGFMEQRIDRALTILTASQGERKILLRWTPGKNFLSNTFIPCIHADPCLGDLAPGEASSVKGELIFTTASWESLRQEFNFL
jgi:hypothetical protein